MSIDGGWLPTALIVAVKLMFFPLLPEVMLPFVAKYLVVHEQWINPFIVDIMYFVWWKWVMPFTYYFRVTEKLFHIYLWFIETC